MLDCRLRMPCSILIALTESFHYVIASLNFRNELFLRIIFALSSSI
jgi:hypothetical protein